MWDGSCDLDTHHNDLPCNTHIYFRVVDGKLNMTVCNRSNDVIWGMTGANAVHMTMLQELIAAEADIPIGSYLVSSRSVLKTQWFREVAYPMYWAYMERKDGGDGSHWVKQIADQNWRTACEKWQEWKA